jgi:hypothetical protein
MTPRVFRIDVLNVDVRTVWTVRTLNVVYLVVLDSTIITKLPPESFAGLKRDLCVLLRNTNIKSKGREYT